MENQDKDLIDDDFGGLAEPKSSEDQILRRFKRKSIAACEWIEDLVRNGHRKTEKRRRMSSAEAGLFMSDEMQDVGVLSIAPSLSALLFELSQLRDGKEADKGKSFSDVLTANGNEVINIVTEAVGRLIAECYPDGLHGNYDRVLFSSTPFYDGYTAYDTSVWEDGGYLDTASWAFLVADSIETFLNRLAAYAPNVYKNLEWKINIDDNAVKITTDEVRKIVRAIYIASVNVTCDCIVRNEDGSVAGWSFRKMKKGEAEPSLYFSYVASTVYLGLFKRFNGTKNVIDKLRTFEAQLCQKSKYEQDEGLKKYKFYESFGNPARLEKLYSWMKRNGFDETAQFLKSLSPDEIAELDFLYNTVNKGQPLTYKADEYDFVDGAFSLLKDASVELAETIWKKGFGSSANKKPFKENMAKGPCFIDGSSVDMDVIRLSSHNNAFFNNLFVIGIILNSAYDAKLAEQNRDEYEKMLNVFQLSIQNTQRCYNEIKDEGLLYKIDSYILDFSDKVDANNVELAKQLRRVNMSVVPLMPLMLKNNNLMSQYVVQYPQKQMTESLKDIIRNRKSGAEGACWVWDKDGYNAITNYYYVDALISFYKYYEQYEKPLISSEEDKRLIEERAVQATEDRLNAVIRNKEAGYSAEIAKRDEYISEVRTVLKGVAKLVVNGLIDVVDEQLTAEKLIGALSAEERRNPDTIIDELNSFDKDSDTVKVSKLVHLSEKLQLLSMLSMDKSEKVGSFLKNGDSQQRGRYDGILNDVFGDGGGSSKFMRNLLIFLVDGINSKSKKTDDDQQ